MRVFFSKPLAAATTAGSEQDRQRIPFQHLFVFCMFAWFSHVFGMSDFKVHVPRSLRRSISSIKQQATEGAAARQLRKAAQLPQTHLRQTSKRTSPDTAR